MPYNVMINEEQRVLLANAMREYCKTRDENEDEATLLLALLDELPEVEKADPGILHGLCL